MEEKLFLYGRILLDVCALGVLIILVASEALWNRTLVLILPSEHRAGWLYDLAEARQELSARGEPEWKVISITIWRAVLLCWSGLMVRLLDYFYPEGN